MHAAIVTFGSSVGQASWSGHLALHGVGDSVDWQVGDLPYTREQRGADLLLLLLLLLLLWPCTESETPWTGRSETCPTLRQDENCSPPPSVRILDFSERGQGRKTELVEACDFMGIKPKNSSWNHGLQQLEPRISRITRIKKGLGWKGCSPGG